MSQDKIYSVTALGLTRNEMRFIRIMLALTSHASTYREQVRYEWSDDLSRVNIVIVNAGDATAMQAWHKLAENNLAITLLLVTATEQIPFTKYYFSRPFGPSKVLMMLDKIVKDHREYVPELQVFSGADKSLQREILHSAQLTAPVRHRALVIDDSPTVRKQLILELGCFNIQVDTAETGEQGLEMLEIYRYDVVFLDVVMPGADGYQVCKQIRRNLETKRTPVVMLTSKSSQFDKVRGSLAGCSAFLTKPVDYENFYQVLEGYLALAKDNPAIDKRYA